jgi:integrase
VQLGAFVVADEQGLEAAAGGLQSSDHEFLEERRAVLRSVADDPRIRRAAVDPNITVQAYSEHWLAMVRSTLKQRTLEGYADLLRPHLLPTLGAIKVRKLDRGRIETLLAAKRAVGLAPGTVLDVFATLRTMLAAAVDDGLLTNNPATGLGRVMRLAHSTRRAAAKLPRVHPPLFTLSRTGLRLGEVLALQWGDLDLERGELRVERALSTDGRIETPKSGHGRSVDVSRSLRELLRSHRAQLAEAWLRVKPEKDANGNELLKGEKPPRVFPSVAWTPLDHNNLAKAFKVPAGRRASVALLPQSPSLVRLAPPGGRRLPRLRPRAARPCLDRTHGRNLRPAAPEEGSGGGRRAGRDAARGKWLQGGSKRG